MDNNKKPYVYTLRQDLIISLHKYNQTNTEI